MPSRRGDAGGRRSALRARLSCVALVVSLFASAARADEIKHPTAVFAGLDKITGRITSFDVAIDETVQFGALQITPRVCLTKPPTETPQTEGFVEVDDVENAKKPKRIFFGWMFAASPGLNGVERPIYDVWLKGCEGAGKLVAWPINNGASQANQPAASNAAPTPVEAKKPERTITPENPVEPTMESLPSTPEDIEPPPQQDVNPEGEPPAAHPPAASPGKPARGKVKELGPPVEIGPSPGAEAPNESQPAPRPKRNRRRHHPAERGNVAPGPQYNEPPPATPRRERLAPMRPQDLPPSSIY